MITSAMAIAIPSIMPKQQHTDEGITKTGTPADHFPDAQRAQFCGSGNAKSNTFIKEYKVPTVCTQPLAITTDSQGTVWFAQTNTGNIAKFDPKTESFTEFQNPSWPENGRSMIWGMDYSKDGSIWYTDENYDSIWKFSIAEGTFQRLKYPAGAESLPQKIKMINSQIIVNDFTGNKITFLDPAQIGEEVSYLSLPSPVEDSFTGSFAVDSSDNLWYTNWIPQKDGVLVKFDHGNYKKTVEEKNDKSLPVQDFIKIFKLPPGLTTPNGIVYAPDGLLWIADTSSNFFFSFDPVTETFSRYVTSIPPQPSYGNFTGLIKTPVSRPYWTAVDGQGRVVFNEQTGNQIGIFDPKSESLVEYLIPSKNPTWADCEAGTDCGLAQAFDFAIDGTKIWFTEWVQNNIGVLDTSTPLPFDVELSTQSMSIKKGDATDVTLTIIPKESGKLNIVTSNTSDFFDVKAIFDVKSVDLKANEPVEIPLKISAANTALAKTHKVLIGASNGDVTISKYISVNILS